MSRKVLVVDDEQYIVDFMERFLIRKGISVVKASNGEFAVEIANGARFARLVRLRIEWGDPNHHPYAVLYEDNYFDLFPGEKKRVPVEFRTPKTFAESIAGTDSRPATVASIV